MSKGRVQDIANAVADVIADAYAAGWNDARDQGITFTTPDDIESDMRQSAFSAYLETIRGRE